MSSSGLIVFAHGSSVESANEAVREVARALAAKGGYKNVEASFLEGGKPDLLGAAEAMLERGVTRVVVLPYFLTVGLHLKRDLPKLVTELKAAHPELTVETAPPLDGHAALVDILLTRAEDALAS